MIIYFINMPLERSLCICAPINMDRKRMHSMIHRSKRKFFTVKINTNIDKQMIDSLSGHVFRVAFHCYIIDNSTNIIKFHNLITSKGNPISLVFIQCKLRKISIETVCQHGWFYFDTMKEQCLPCMADILCCYTTLLC